MTKVWVNKTELIDMILNQLQQSSQTLQTSQSGTQSRSSPDKQVTHPDVTSMSDVTDVPQPLPSCEAQLTSIDDVLDSHGKLPSNIPSNVNQTSIIDPLPTPIRVENDTAEPPALEAHQLTTDDTHPSPPPHHHKCDLERKHLQDITKDIKTIMTKLETKDTEIELLNTEVKTAYSIIQLLQQRISDLEQEYKSRRHDAATHITTSSKCLLLGDTNTRRVFSSDLDHNSIVKTVTHANIDLLRSWVTEQLQSVPSECIILGGV